MNDDYGYDDVSLAVLGLLGGLLVVLAIAKIDEEYGLSPRASGPEVEYLIDSNITNIQ